jgi:hypothetical protein
MKERIIYGLHCPRQGSCGIYSKADAAARWVAQETGESVSVVNECTAELGG